MATSGLNNVVQIQTSQIPTVLEKFWAMNEEGKHLVPALFGKPGTGKTALTKQFAKMKAKQLGLKFVENPSLDDWKDKGNFCLSFVLISQIEEIDTRGLPNIKVNGGGEAVTVFTMTELFPTFGTGIVFLDEFPNGRTQVQNAMQPIILEHASGNFKISKDIMFVVAGNRPEDNCGTFYVPSALRNRLAWYEVNRPKAEDWISQMDKVGKTIDPRISGFLLTIGEKFLDNFNPKMEQYAYGTMRSWEMASEAIRGEKDNAKLKMFLGGFVGADAAIDLTSFLKLSEKVDIKEVLNNPEKIRRYENGDIGVLYSICVAMLDYAKDEKDRPKLWDVMHELGRAEYTIFIAQAMTREFGKAKAIESVKKAKHGVDEMKKVYHLLDNSDD